MNLICFNIQKFEKIGIKSKFSLKYERCGPWRVVISCIQRQDVIGGESKMVAIYDQLRTENKGKGELYSAASCI